MGHIKYKNEILFKYHLVWGILPSQPCLSVAAVGMMWLLQGKTPFQVIHTYLYL